MVECEIFSCTNPVSSIPAAHLDIISLPVPAPSLIVVQQKLLLSFIWYSPTTFFASRAFLCTQERWKLPRRRKSYKIGGNVHCERHAVLPVTKMSKQIPDNH